MEVFSSAFPVHSLIIAFMKLIDSQLCCRAFVKERPMGGLTLCSLAWDIEHSLELFQLEGAVQMCLAAVVTVHQYQVISLRTNSN